MSKNAFLEGAMKIDHIVKMCELYIFIKLIFVLFCNKTTFQKNARFPSFLVPSFSP